MLPEACNGGQRRAEAPCASALGHTTNCPDVIRGNVNMSQAQGEYCRQQYAEWQQIALSRLDNRTRMRHAGAEDGGPSNRAMMEEGCDGRKGAGPFVPSQGVPGLPT